jgi:hypothetical protein
MEVIETTGGAPFPARFFLTNGDETGLTLPRKAGFDMQLVGAARLADGTLVGGVRHQFRSTSTGFHAIFAVEFPGATAGFIIRQHELHLACEWRNWIVFFEAEKNG